MAGGPALGDGTRWRDVAGRRVAATPSDTASDTRSVLGLRGSATGARVSRMTRLTTQTYRVRLTPDSPAVPGHPLLAGYRPDPLTVTPRGSQAPTPAAPAVPPPGGMLGPTGAAAALGIPESVLRHLASTRPDLVPAVLLVDGQPCLPMTDEQVQR